MLETTCVPPATMASHTMRCLGFSMVRMRVGGCVSILHAPAAQHGRATVAMRPGYGRTHAPTRTNAPTRTPPRWLHAGGLRGGGHRDTLRMMCSTGNAPPVAGISAVTGTPTVPVHHADHTRVMPLILRASSPTALLKVFEDEREGFGWYTAAQIITRVGRFVCKKPRGAVLNRQDPRWLGVLGVLDEALRQGVVSNKARNGHDTDDLTLVKAALEDLGETGVPLYEPLCKQILDDGEDRTTKSYLVSRV